MKKILRLIFINIAILLTILIFLNISSILIFNVYNLLKSDFDPRSNLPNYKNITWAETHFKEFKNLPSVYRSYVGWRRLPFNGKTINIDERGIRSTFQPSSNSNSLPLVTFTGGSALWGTGSDDNNTIPSLLTEISGGKLHALNLGESGYNSFQGYLFLKLQVMNGLIPNIIVSYDGANEIDALNRGNRIFSHARENQINAAIKGLDRNEVLTLRHYFIDPLIAFINKFKAKFYKNTTDNYDLSTERLDMVASAFLNSWKSINDLADQNQAVFIGVLQPTIYTGNPRTDHLKIDNSLEPVYHAFYKTVIKKLKDPEFIELSNCVLDLGKIFDSDEYIFIDEIHVSPNGNRIAASKIYNFILDHKWDNKEK
jgi:hypothetical protein